MGARPVRGRLGALLQNLLEIRIWRIHCLGSLVDGVRGHSGRRRTAKPEGEIKDGVAVGGCLLGYPVHGSAGRRRRSREGTCG